jgi:hypothetical protein
MPARARKLTDGERRLSQSVFGDAIDCTRVRIIHRRWWPFQPREVAMAPTGNIHIPPNSSLWSDDFGEASIGLQALFLHEMTHVWQAQTRGGLYLVLMRHPFCRYSYSLEPGRALEDYGLEQQAEIVRHFFLLRQGAGVAGAAPVDAYRDAMPPSFAARQVGETH